MEDLIKALQIFMKYKNEKYPTHCEHDVLMVGYISHNEVSDEDELKLQEFGFFFSDDHDSWISYRYGSC